MKPIEKKECTLKNCNFFFSHFRHTEKESVNPTARKEIRQLEKFIDRGIMHDATIHWVKEINIVFCDLVSGDGRKFRVPFSEFLAHLQLRNSVFN